MSLNINEYIGKTNYWNSIKEYVISKNNIDVTADNSDGVVLKFIQNAGKRTLGSSYEKFDKFLRNYKNGNFHTFKRSTLILLIFALEINDVDEVQSFCRNVVHHNELSARSLTEFIILCAINMKLSYEEASTIIDKYSEKIKELRYAPSKAGYYRTYTIYDDVIKEQIHTIDDLYNYLDSEDNISEFAHTRNTTYLMLFDEVNWEVWDSVDWKMFFNEYPDHAPDNYSNYSEDDWNEYIKICQTEGIENDLQMQLIAYCASDDAAQIDNLSAEDLEKLERKSAKQNAVKQKVIKSQETSSDINFGNFYSLKAFYLYHFSLTNGKGLYLTESEIETLAADDSYSTAFVTYNLYRKIYRRETPSEISAGVYLLSLVQKYISDDEDSDEYATLFSEGYDFIEECNTILSYGGFASLNPNNMFDKLFIDTYNEVLRENNDINSPNLKPLFLERLCGYLKQVAQLLSK